MEDVAKQTGLVRRKDSASWQFRQRWPKHLRRPGDPADIWISLETTSYQDALRKLPEVREEAQRRFTHADEADQQEGIYSRTPRPRWPDDQSLPLLQRGQVASLAQAFFAEVISDMDAEAPVPWAKGDEGWQSWRCELEDILARLTGPETFDSDDLVMSATIRVLRNANLRAQAGDEACNLLHNLLRRALAQSYQIMLARLDGNYSDRITDSAFGIFPSGHPRQPMLLPAAQEVHPGKTSLDPDLVDLWAAERKVSAKGVDKHRAVAKWFRDYVGEMPVEAVTKRDVLAFKNKLVADGVSAANANAKLSCLRTLLGFAVDNDLLAANPADRVYVHDKDKDRRKRKEFDLPALHALFSSPVYVADDRPTQGRGEAAYWMPLVALYTGARLEEIAQLRVTDVREETYIDGRDAERTAWGHLCGAGR